MPRRMISRRMISPGDDSPCGSSRRWDFSEGRGFTALELLVSFGIIALLISLLLPLLQRAIQTSRRTQCQNNLKQINLALSMYHDLNNTFPPGYISRGVRPTDDATQETGTGFAWGSLLLSYLEHRHLSETLDFNQDVTDSVNLGTTSHTLSFWTCPADDAFEPMDVNADFGPILLGSASYVGMYGFGSLTEQPGASPGPGILYRNSFVGAAQIRDGCSNTIIVGERKTRYQIDTDSQPLEAGAVWAAAVPGAFRPAGIPQHPDFREGPASLVLGTVGQKIPFPYESRPNATTHIGAFSSNHAGGFHAALADTSVRFLHDDINFEVLKHLAQRSDHQPLGEF